MATARIVQFGEDNCHRLTVLEGAGYVVERCRSLTEFRRVLTAEPADAVVLTEGDGATTLEAISAAQSLPVILFENLDESYADAADLVIPALTSPASWLAQIRETIERSRVLCKETERLGNEAALLRSASQDARMKSEVERARSRSEYSRNRELLKSDANRLDPHREC